MPQYLGLSAVGWSAMTENWWELILVVLSLSAVVSGLGYVIFVTYKGVKKYRKARKLRSVMSTTVARYFGDLRSKAKRISRERTAPKEQKSFGVFIGGFENPPTPNQVKLLSQWDIIILDPLQIGVLDAVSFGCTSRHIVGRLDVGKRVESERTSGDNEVIIALGIVTKTLITSFKRSRDVHSPFTGVLLANWEKHFSPVICNELIKYMKDLGLDVYLEISPPKYLSEKESRSINMELISGIVCRNGTIMANGERRNYFQMADMRSALRALAVHARMSNSIVMMWETVEDYVDLDHAVAKRSYTLCNFSSAISWIGPKAALTNAEVAAAKTLIGEPLGALMWLKSDSIMKTLEVWRANDKITEGAYDDHSIYDSLQSYIPNLTSRLDLMPLSNEGSVKTIATRIDDFEWPSQVPQERSNPVSFSSHSDDYTGLGCFQLGLESSWKDFTDLVQQQRSLRDLDLLESLTPAEIRRIGGQLESLYATKSSWARIEGLSQTVKELVDLTTNTNGDDDDRLRIFIGLDSGFRTSLDTQVWGLYDVEPSSGIMNIYLSGKAKDRAGTILHTFMSSKEFTREECFMAEFALSEQNGCLTETWGFPERVEKDIKDLTPTENLLFVRRLALSDSGTRSEFAAQIIPCFEYQLMVVPSIAQLKALNATAYLRNEISASDLVKSRLAWYKEQGCQYPDPSAAIALFKEIDSRLPQFLMDQQSDLLSQLETVFQTILQKNQIDASADLFALSIFCAFRKLALSEVYMEITDRNPLQNAHPDQAACFAEMFALGSGCEAYFDMTPNVIGEILSERSRAYYKKNQPPARADDSTELPTAFSSSMVDLDPNAGPPTVPLYYQVTFLGIFALPALADILLLSTIGRGLYLTSYMSQDVKSAATTALMSALLLCGAVGTWISSGGSYYFHSMAFGAMNMFVMTRFIGGLAITLTGGIVAVIVISLSKGIFIGIVFFIYFFILSTYLSVLAGLAIYQLPGFMFQSGRLVIITRMPILLLSPILTLFIGHDVVVYLSVMSGFLVSLLFGARRVLSEWSNWYLKVPTITDTELVNWYTETKASSDPAYDDVVASGVDLGATPLPRRALLADLRKELNRHRWTKPTSDKMVRKLAEGHPATLFLMDWYCKYSRTKMPLAFSPTWNLQCKAGLETLRDMQKGLKLHNAFLHWRHAGSEVWCGVIYFVLALLDKWVALFSGGSMVGLSNASSEIYRLSVGFGLAYYLIGAVCLDAVSQPLWALANKPVPQAIKSLDYLRKVATDDARGKRQLYVRSLIKFFFVHIWGLSLFAALMWTFDNSSDATIMFIAYVCAYTGLLWYQFNRIFAGPLVLNDLMIAVVVGLTSGMLLNHFQPQCVFNSVIGLGAGTWSAAALSFWTAKIRLPTFKKGKLVHAPSAVYSSSTLGSHPQLSQGALSEIFNSISNLPVDLRYRLDPLNHPGVEVMKLLLSQGNCLNSRLTHAAFLAGEKLVHQAASLWENGDTVVDIVSARHLIQQDQQLRTISRTEDDQLHIVVFIGLDLSGDYFTIDIRRNCKIIAEAVIQATFESKLGLSREHSILAEVLASTESSKEGLLIPEGIKRQLEGSATERLKVIKNGEKELLRDLLLGINCDTEWDYLPTSIRSFLLKRSRGERCIVSDEQLGWIRSRFGKDNSFDHAEHFARSNLGATLTSLVTSFAKALEADRPYHDFPEDGDSECGEVVGDLSRFSPANNISHKTIVERVTRPIAKIHHILKMLTKFFVLSLVADGEYQRELDFFMTGTPGLLRWPAVFFLNGMWKFCKSLQGLILPIVLFHGREKVAKLARSMKGMKTVIEKNRIVIESLSGQSTCFTELQSDGTTQVSQYSGDHDKKPDGLKQLMAINTYTDKLVLLQREEYAKESLVNNFTYHYPGADASRQTVASKLPIERECVEGDLNGQIVQYDENGYITSGSVIKDDNLIKFKFWYRKDAKYNDELLRAEYNLPYMIVRVTWAVPPAKRPEKLYKWLPHSKVTAATFIRGPEIYETKWHYEHKFHPVIMTTLNGEPVDTPPMIEEDWLDVLKKPKNCRFLDDNPLLSFNSAKSNIISRFFGRNSVVYPISTANARTHLWKTWKGGKDMDAVTTRWLDDIAVRSDKLLRPYWRARDMGLLYTAEDYFDSCVDNIMAGVDLDPEISAWTLIAYKISDFYTFGEGGDARINTRSQASQMHDSDTELHILAMDTGTWPNESGGVSACRRDMVNNLDSIKWHVLAECANDYGVPRFQIEKNVQSLTILPLWGLDFLTPTHGIFQNCLDTAVQRKSYDTRDNDIIRNFIPILTTLVRLSRAIHLDLQQIEEGTKAMVDLNTYFETGPHWSDVWMSDLVKDVWRELWLTEDMENTKPISQWLEAERPTLLHMDQALDMWQRYLFIFSLPVPEKIPDVFQASHHFAGASYGVVCKMKRNCTLHVWDHCISWREVTVFLSSAMSFDPPFVGSALMSLSRLCSVVILHHADVVLPCADFFNPGWEIELGTGQGTRGHRRTYNRKIDPVVNGITDMEKFEPIETIKSTVPTVMMLSHVRFVKDIKNAILAADIIVNKWGFKTYRLEIYGDMEKAPTYSVECQEMIASKSLRDNVALKGLGSPSKVLENAWLFLNSSISEGLPLAMGEAALTGVPVVCTDVGASFRVVTDPITFKRFSAVVAPNDAESLARAQVNVLALLDEWSEFADDEEGYHPKLSLHPTPEEAEKYTKRMHDKVEQRRRLGMMGRTNVLNSFSEDRYLREHEQMLWIGKYQSPSYRARVSRKVSSSSESITTLNDEKAEFVNSSIPKLMLESSGASFWSRPDTAATLTV